MTTADRALRDAAQRPFRLPYHPLYRFYEGGSQTRAFRGLPNRPDDWWSEDWVGSCTIANNAGPDGRPQGLTEVDIPGRGAVSLKALIEAEPGAMVGDSFASHWGPITGLLVKLLSPARQVPLHAHPDRAWARRHLDSPFGKTECWILLATPDDGREPAYAGIGFREGISPSWFGEAVRRHDNAPIRATLHRLDVAAGQVFVAHAGIPHYLGPGISFIEIQEPSDHIVIPETDGGDDDGATMGLGWDEALDMIDYRAEDRATTLARARQVESVVRVHHGSRETRLLNADVLEFFDATRLDVSDELPVEDGRFSIDIVIGGDGTVEGDFGAEAVRSGQTLAFAASLGHRYRAGTGPLRVIRCMGPSIPSRSPS